MNVTHPQTELRPTCQWCGRELAVQKGRGRRRKYCSAACKQRAYEQRHNFIGTAIPQRAVIMAPDKAESLRDDLYALRCAAEDIATACSENAGRNEIQQLCNELVSMAKSIEKLR
nr:hypothetical protein [Corynebacterium cystitidis]